MSKTTKFVEFVKREGLGAQQASDHWHYCSRNNYPLIEVSGKDEKVEVHWDYFSMDGELDDVLLHDKTQKIGKEMIWGFFQLVANEKSELVPGATVGWIRNITIEQARKVAPMIFDYLCLASEMKTNDE